MDNFSFAILCFVVSAISMGYFAVTQFQVGNNSDATLWLLGAVVALVVALFVFLWRRR